MGWLSFLICVIPLYLLYNTGNRVLWFLTVINAIANLWSYGVMHNFAVSASAERIKSLRKNLALENRFDAEKEKELDRLKLRANPQAVPNWLATVNMITFFGGIGLLGYGIWSLLRS